MNYGELWVADLSQETSCGAWQLPERHLLAALHISHSLDENTLMRLVTISDYMPR